MSYEQWAFACPECDEVYRRSDAAACCCNGLEINAHACSECDKLYRWDNDAIECCSHLKQELEHE